MADRPVLKHDQKSYDMTIDKLFPQIHTEHIERRHEAPPPRQTTDDISMCIETNEWVLNHLPLKEEQKEKLIAQLQADQMKEKKKEASKKWKMTYRIPKPIQTDFSKTGVKELTKQKS